MKTWMFTTSPSQRVQKQRITLKNKYVQSLLLSGLWPATSRSRTSKTGPEAWGATSTRWKTRSEITRSMKPGVLKRMSHFKAGSHWGSESTASRRSWGPDELPTRWPVEIGTWGSVEVGTWGPTEVWTWGSIEVGMAGWWSVHFRMFVKVIMGRWLVLFIGLFIDMITVRMFVHLPMLSFELIE